MLSQRCPNAANQRIGPTAQRIGPPVREPLYNASGPSIGDDNVLGRMSEEIFHEQIGGTQTWGEGIGVYKE